MEFKELERVAQAWADHGRQFGQYQFVYPVLSRRAGGISLGVNLNPDLHCNFACPYCQVDRSSSPSSLPSFSLPLLRRELLDAVSHWMHNRFTDSPRFQGISPHELDLKDLCLSGDGEPTLAKEFAEVCSLLADIQRGLGELQPAVRPKLVLISNATLLHQPRVQKGLRALTSIQGEIWGKLDGGSDAWIAHMSQAPFTAAHLERNLCMTAMEFPLRIQTMLCRYDGSPPSPQELQCYAERILRIYEAGPQNLLEIQLYTIVRHTAENSVQALPMSFLQETAAWLRTQLPIPVNAYG